MAGRIQKRLSSMTIRSKLFLLFGVFTLLIFTLGIRFSGRMTRTYTENFYKSAEANRQQLVVNITKQMTEWTSLLETISSNPIFYQFLQKDTLDQYEAYTIFRDSIQPLLRSLLQDVAVDDIRVYSDNRNLRISSITNNAYSDITEYSWYFDTDDILGWRYSQEQRGMYTKHTLCCGRTRQLHFESGKSGTGVFMLYLKPDCLDSYIHAEQLRGSRIFLADAYGTIIMSTDDAYLYKSISELESALPDMIDGAVVSFDEGEYHLSLTQFSPGAIGMADWQLLYLTPVASIGEGTRSIWQEMIALCLVCLVISGYFVFTITGNITRRINLLLEAMDKVRCGRFSSAVLLQQKDEIGIMEESFNQTVERLDSLVQEVSQATNRALKAELDAQILLRIQRESELLSLQHQMNPHYLFNTFESIRMELVRQGNRELATILRAFAQNVRASLYENEGPYKLENELRLVRNFIQIQEYRQPNRIRFELDVNPELMECLVPKLCIQPLLENAVLHGMDGRDSGVVQVRIGRIGSNVYISVEDDGVGIPQQRLEQVRLIIYGDAVNAEKLLSRGYSALRNVHQRLELIYGKTYGLTINSVEGRFTRTEMLIPMQYEQNRGDERELSDR